MKSVSRLALIVASVFFLCLGQGRAQSQVADWGGGSASGQFVSSNSGPNIFAGLNINQRIGATSFYTAGYNGSRSIVANIEAGHVWSGHETLAHVTTFLNGPGTVGAVSGNSAAFDRHATWVGQAIAGRRTAVGPAEYQRGIADGATLWSGSIATSWNGSPYALSFNFNTYSAFINPYRTAMVTGVAGQTADVINSSWGFSGDSTGRSLQTRGIDALVSQTGKIVTFSAGNSGSGSNTVLGPSTGYNVWTIAALGSDTDNPTYNTVSTFSSRGPSDVFIPTTASGTAGTTISNARVKVDLAAPGQGLTLAFYGGTTGGNTGGTASLGSNLYSGNTNGTSFAAPTVAGGAALVVDAAKANNLTLGVDTRVVKTILMTTADKTAGWTNATTNVAGVLTTTQALDVNVGAGRMNLTRALPLVNSASATRDVAGTNRGNLGTVAAFGWDYGVIDRLGNNTYFVNAPLTVGAGINVTLNWLARRSITGEDFTTLLDNGLANLDLEVWRIVNGVFTTKVASSSTLYNNTEHLSFTVPQDGDYGIRIDYIGDVYRFDGNTAETYGLAWEFTPVPEPAAAGTVAAVLYIVLHRLRRRSI